MERHEAVPQRASGRRRWLIALGILSAAGLATWAAISGRTAPVAPPPASPPVIIAPARSLYVSPDGVATNDGTQAHPLDLATALSEGSPARPGDTIWLLQGVYRGSVVAQLNGAPTAPIYVKQYPRARVTLDGAGSLAGTLTIFGSDLWFWGFEVTNSDPVRVFKGQQDADTRRATGISVHGARVRLINLSVHDAMNGFSVSEKGRDVQIYGCLAYNNGVRDDKGVYGQGIYVQNSGGLTQVLDSVAFNNHGRGLTAVSERGLGDTFVLNGIVSFNNGHGDGASSFKAANVTVTSTAPDGELTLTDSHLYHVPNTSGENVSLGNSQEDSGRLFVERNTVTGGSVSFRLANWGEATVSGNRLLTQGTANTSSDQSIVQLHTTVADVRGYRWTTNAYFDLTGPAHAFVFNNVTNTMGGGNLNFGEWQKATSFDRDSKYSQSAPTGTDVHVRVNRYDANSALVVVYNWDRAATVKVPLDKAAWKPGVSIEVISVHDFFGPSVYSGIYDGQPVTLSMSDLSSAGAVGTLEVSPSLAVPEFAVFVVRVTSN